MSPAGWAASNMKQRADRVGDLTERLGVDDPGVGGGPGHDQAGLLGLGQSATWSKSMTSPGASGSSLAGVTP